MRENPLDVAIHTTAHEEHVSVWSIINNRKERVVKKYPYILGPSCIADEVPEIKLLKPISVKMG
jgi:hypothetical protein